MEKKKEIKIDGTVTRILGELSILIQELREDVEDDKIMFSVKLGLCGDDLSKMLDVAKETILNNIKKSKENKNNENTKENIL